MQKHCAASLQKLEEEEEPEEFADEVGQTTSNLIVPVG